MKPIYKSLALAAMTLQVSLALQAKVNDGESVTESAVLASSLDGLKVELVSPNITGARDLIASGECVIDGENLTISLNAGDWVKGATYSVRVSAVFGTQTVVLYVLNVSVPRYAALASDPQEYEDTIAVVSTFGDGTGENDLQRAKNVTHAQLKALKDAGSLVAGQTYRITDYVTTTAADNIQSAGHAFDLIVTALDAHTLSEKAHAVPHEGDEYFTDCDLAVWDVWYTIENDATHYDWADTENGKGVIYRLIDEWRNDYPFDFKNIMFKRWAVTGLSHSNPNIDVSDLEDDFVYNEGSQDIRYGTQGENYTQGNLTFEVEDETDFAYYYALSWIAENGGVQDASIVGQTLLDDEGFVSGVYGNSCGVLNSGANENTQFSLPNNTIISSYSYEDGLFYGCYSNTFGNDCYSNTFGNGCYSNTFGNYCSSNTFGNYCSSNTFGNNCHSNTFGNYCSSNTFGNGCSSNTFGNDCHSNTFGNGCYSNTFGNYCSSNTFGNGCYSNTFGNGSQNDAILKDYMRYVTLETGVQFVDITCTETTSESAYGQNILIHSGVVGASDARKTCSIDDAGNDFLTEFGTVVQGTIS